ncbi:MAG TPA: Crp/Fnr family transcriptional regulator [Acidobacteriaceae bacterium]
MNEVPTNQILSMLPLAVKTALMRGLEPVALPVRTVLYEPERMPDHVHFMTSGMASVVTSMRNGEVVEVGLVGYEGVAEALHLLGPALLQTTCFMQIAGTGLRMRFGHFQQQLFGNEQLLRPVLGYVQYQALVLAQVAACNRLHEVQERFARWLLMVADRVDDPKLGLTQEFLGQMLGSRRSTVTQVAGELQRAGIIHYSRGQVHILNRAALEDVACECYQVTRDALDRFRGTALEAAGSYS